MSTRELPNTPLPSQQVYSATYSNVPVYEFLTPNGSVMRRKSDGWVNATHILKIANFPKAKRTRILEKDVQTGVHEKVQGGYGKYQGTWVPLDRAVEIAQEFAVEVILAPLFDFVKTPGSQSPPPAPKHHNASSKLTRLQSMSVGQRITKLAALLLSLHKMASLPVTKKETDSSAKITRKRGRPPKLNVALVPLHVPLLPLQLLLLHQLNVQLNVLGPQLLHLQLLQLHHHHHDYNLPPIQNSYPNQSSYSPDTPMLHQPSSSPSDFMSDTDLAALLRSPEQSFQPKHYLLQHGNGDNLHDVDDDDQDDDDENELDSTQYPSWYFSYRNSLLEYFHTPDDGITDTPLPEFLSHPPPGFDINHGVDKENNTALHWACAVGDLRITDTLLKCGALTNALNNEGVIPIMRSVLFTNPYERRTFPKLLDLLRESLLDISQNSQSILHLILNSTNTKISTHASRYYMEMLLGKLSGFHPREIVVNFVNRQDNDGNTALHLISKAVLKKFLKILLAYGARIDIPNKLGERMEDYLNLPLHTSFSNQHFELSQPQQQQQHQQQQAVNPYYHNPLQHLPSASLTTSIPRIMPVPHFSELAIQANQIVSNQMTEGLEELANSYDLELQSKEEEINEIKSMLTALNNEINEINDKLSNAKDFEMLKLSKLQDYESKTKQLRKLLERSQSKDLAALVQQSEQELALSIPQTLSIDHNDIIELALLQLKRSKFVDKMLTTLLSNKTNKIDKYKHLMHLCLKGSMEGGDTDKDDDDDDDDQTMVDDKNGDSKLKLKFDNNDEDEELLLDILINNLDPYQVC